MDDKLTIVIPTYNRRERLLNLLHTIYKQPESEGVLISICDNHSDYNVRDAIVKEFGEKQSYNLSVFVNKYNFGMNANLSSTFLHCNTKWMWIIGDDDEAIEGSLATILMDIKQHPNTTLFKYSNIDYHFTNKDVHTFPEFISYIKEGGYPTGLVIFMSNNVYNMEYVEKYYGNTLSYCYCAFGHLLPAFNALDNKDGIVRFREAAVAAFNSAEANQTWNYINAVMGISSVPSFPYDLTDKQFKDLGTILLRGFAHIKIIINCLETKDRKHGKYLYKQIYSRVLKYSGRIKDKFFFILFFVCYYLHVRIGVNTALRIKDRIMRINPSLVERIK